MANKIDTIVKELNFINGELAEQKWLLTYTVRKHEITFRGSEEQIEYMTSLIENYNERLQKNFTARMKAKKAELEQELRKALK